MDIQSLFTPEMLIILQVAFIGALSLFLLVKDDFTRGIYIWLLAVLFFKSQKMDFSGSILPDISIARILFMFLAGMFFLGVLSRKRRFFRPTLIEHSMLLFSLFAVISMIWTGSILKDGGRLSIGELLTGVVFPFFMFFISQSVYDTHKKRESFIKFIMLVGLYLGLTAFFEHFKVYSLIWPKYIMNPYFGIHYGRARGPFTQAAVNGTVLGFALISAFYFLLTHRNKMLAWRSYAWLSVVLLPFAIFFTYTRAPWIAAIIGMGLIFIAGLRYNKKVFIMAVFALLIAALLSASFLDDETLAFASRRATNENPVYDRLNLYVASVNMFMHYPIFGVGFGRFSEHVAGYFRNIDGIPFNSIELSEHDTFMGILAEMGIAGVILIASIYFLILSRSIRLYKIAALHDTKTRVITIIFWGFMLVFVVNSMFIEMRYFEFVNCLFFVFAGIICGMERQYRVNQKTV